MPEKASRDFVFFVNTNAEVAQFHYLTPTALENFDSREIPRPQEGSRIAWKILCNPVKRQHNKKVALKSPEEGAAWLKRHLEECFTDLTIACDMLPTEKGVKPSGHTILIKPMAASGLGTLSNADRLLEITTKGIGPSKSFGYGCLLWNIIRKN